MDSQWSSIKQIYGKIKRAGVVYGKRRPGISEIRLFPRYTAGCGANEGVEYLEASGIDVLRLSDMTEDPNAADRDLLLDDDDIDLSGKIDMENIDLSVPKASALRTRSAPSKEIGKCRFFPQRKRSSWHRE